MVLGLGMHTLPQPVEMSVHGMLGGKDRPKSSWPGNRATPESAHGRGSACKRGEGQQTHTPDRKHQEAGATSAPEDRGR